MHIEYWDKEKVKNLTQIEKENWFDVYNNGLEKDRGFDINKLSQFDVDNIKNVIQADYLKYLDSLVDDKNFVFYTILKNGTGKIVSLCRLVKRAGLIYLAGLETHQDFRSQGYGKGVLLATTKLAFENGYESINSVVRKWNEASIRIHKSVGYTVSSDKNDNLLLSLSNINLIVKPMIEEFLNKPIKTCKLISERTGLDDIRLNYEIEVKDTKYVVKLHSNNFTTTNKIYETIKLIEIHNNNGYYSPKYINSSIYGNAHNYKIFGRTYCLWIEEYKKYLSLTEKLNESTIPEIDLDYLYNNQIPEYIGKIAASSRNLKFNSNSPYRLYEAFNDPNAIDEYEEYVGKIYNLLKNDINIDYSLLNRIYKKFYKLRRELSTNYHDLPESIFQADLHSENILVDDDFNFKGVIDFNLAGREKVLTYLINELAYQETEPISKLWIDKDYIEKQIAKFRGQLKIFRKYYQFNELESQLINDLYKIIIPFKCFPLTEIIGYFKLKDYKEINYRLLWMEIIINLDLKLI